MSVREAELISDGVSPKVAKALFIKNQPKDFTILTLLTMTYTNDPVATLDQLPPPESISEEKRLQILAAIDKARVALEPPLVSVQNLVFSVCAS